MIVDSITPLKLGDIVQLKSGGPNMTILKIGASHGSNVCDCAWFRSGGASLTLDKGSFVIEALVKPVKEDEDD